MKPFFFQKLTPITKCHFLALLVCYSPFFFTSCQPSTSKASITIAAAANTQFAIKALAQAFTAKTKIDCDLVISSSGKLTAQIKEGAPYDLLLAANMKYPNDLEKNGKTALPPKVFAYGKLVLWTMQKDWELKLALLEDPRVQHIALANPITAPYGTAAQTVLDNYGFSQEVSEKLVYGESIAQTNQFITSMAAEIGFTALSVVLSSKLKDKGQWEIIDPKKYAPIEQGVVLINRENGPLEQAKLFYDFLFSAEGQEILKDFGYLINE